MRRGLYRVHGADGRPDDVRIDDDGIDIPMEEGFVPSAPLSAIGRRSDLSGGVLPKEDAGG